jgi:hypothetical protein
MYTINFSIDQSSMAKRSLKCPKLSSKYGNRHDEAKFATHSKMTQKSACDYMHPHSMRSMHNEANKNPSDALCTNIV